MANKLPGSEMLHHVDIGGSALKIQTDGDAARVVGINYAFHIFELKGMARYRHVPKYDRLVELY